MGIKTYKPTTPGIRWKTGYTFEEITKGRPEKKLLRALSKRGGRNRQGHITVPWRGGGNKRRLRIIDFKRDKIDIPAKVLAIEYDPNRTSRIALLEYSDGERRYILAPMGLKVNDEVIAGGNAEIKPGNTLPLRNILPGTPIHNIEIIKGAGGQLVRSAGALAQIMAKEGDFAQVKLSSGEIRLVHLDCMATIGQVGNTEHETISIGKAGRRRHMGRKPRVRARAMNPHDHPLGGGEGKSAGGRHPCSPKGIPAKGFKTRKKKRYSNRYIIKRRK
jgi:large subunit ribosomal protein L2